MPNKNDAFNALRQSITSYSPLSNDTWLEFKNICTFKSLNKNTLIYNIGKIPTSYSYIYKGLIRGFTCDEKGNEYNKVFFDEGMFPGSMTALLTTTPSELACELLEDSILIEINFKAYRELLHRNNEIKLFQIYYLEKNWLLIKEAREISIVQDDATERYSNFIALYPTLADRLPQYHIASHLGITPTQLSRIRKKITNQPM